MQIIIGTRDEVERILEQGESKKAVCEIVFVSVKCRFAMQ
jgi:hypothetical protein